MSSINFITRSSILYGILAFTFSLIGLFLPGGEVIGNPLDPNVTGISAEHIIGHMVWGLMAGIASMSLKYFISTGLFAIILDSDHLLQFLDLECLS